MIDPAIKRRLNESYHYLLSYLDISPRTDMRQALVHMLGNGLESRAEFDQILFLGVSAGWITMHEGRDGIVFLRSTRSLTLSMLKSGEENGCCKTDN